MRRSIWLLAPVMALAVSAGAAETSTATLNGFGLGWKLSNLAGNIAIGAALSSPRFFHDKVHVDVSGDFAWLPGVPVGGTSSTPWKPYGEIRAGLCSDYARVDPFRVYGCGGAFLVLPSNDISSQSMYFGGYGTVDFEFLLGAQRHDLAYVELGAQGTGASADRFPGNPSFANGFVTSVGWKYFFD